MSDSKQVAVIGLGYVGLPLAVAIANAGHFVVGIDVNSEIVRNLNLGQSHIADIKDSEINRIIENGLFKAHDEAQSLSKCQIILICVPTPLSNSQKSDLTYIESAITLISKYLVKDQLLILESTVAPETTRKYIVPLVYEQSKLQVGDLYIAFSPERIDPGNLNWNLSNTPKLLSRINSESEKIAKEFYSSFISNIHVCSTIEVAETAKLLENSFRLLNISFINELSKFCEKLDIDINEVIDAASTKPYGFMPFRPSLGAGGHCIPVDPIYLLEKARDIGSPLKTIELAAQINYLVPEYFIEKASNALGNLQNKKVLVVGVSYKPNISDVRETPVERLIEGLKRQGAIVSWHDDLVKQWKGESSVPLSTGYDLAILATPHDYLDLAKLGEVRILDTRGSI